MFRGWYVVAGAFAIMCIGFGNAYTFSAFVPSLQHEFAASRGSVSLVFSLAGFVYFALGVASGPLADRYGSRPLCIAGMAAIGLGMGIAGLARSLSVVYVAYGLGVGLGVGLSYVPAVGAVQRWFLRRRGLASGLAVSGIGVGTLVLPWGAVQLIGAVGWRQAYGFLGVIAAVVVVGAACLIENDPAKRGLTPDGEPASPRGRRDAPAVAEERLALPDAAPAVAKAGRAAADASAPGVTAPEREGLGTVGEAVRSRRFGMLYAACLACSFGMFTPVVHLLPYALDHGIEPRLAAWLIPAVGIGSTGGRFFLGGIADRMGRAPALLFMMCGMAALLLVWAASSAFWSLSCFALLYGVFYGGFVAVLPALTMDYFGGRHVSGVIGILYTSIAFGTLIAPAAAGYAYDWSGSYTPAIVACAVGDGIAAVIMLRLMRLR